MDHVHVSSRGRTASELINRTAVPSAPLALDWRERIKGAGGLYKLAKMLALSTGYDRTRWVRLVMERECLRLLEQINSQQLTALEISGEDSVFWSKARFASYETTSYPDFDICAEVLDMSFDLIIANQVWEHLLWPHRAGKHVYEMLKPGGYFLITAPFLLKVHGNPVDCSRWTDVGLKYFLAECGFDLARIHTASWGNRACVRANFTTWAQVGWGRPLRNEPDFPVVVWALAQKA